MSIHIGHTHIVSEYFTPTSTLLQVTNLQVRHERDTSSVLTALSQECFVFIAIRLFPES